MGGAGGAGGGGGELQAVARARVGFIQHADARIGEARLQRLAVRGAAALAVERDPRVHAAGERRAAHRFGVHHGCHEVDGGLVGHAVGLCVELARVDGADAERGEFGAGLRERGAQHGARDAERGGVVAKGKRQGVGVPRVTRGRCGGRGAERGKERAVRVPLGGRAGHGRGERVHAALKVPQRMAGGFLRALQLLAVLDGDAPALVVGGAADRARKQLPQAGRRGVRRGIRARQHERRAAHAQWAKQRAVSGFIDACVEERHGGRVRGGAGMASGGVGT